MPKSDLIPPPPFGLHAREAERLSPGAAAVPVVPKVVSPARQNPILRPRTTRDVVALIFILLMLPQGISCIVLTAYILSGSFKSIAGKAIAKYLVHFGETPEYSPVEKPTRRYRYYRAELVGEFLQLFSINSFILLVCHYTLPKSWLQYLIVLAKSIIASRLVGSYTTGSTTFVSVVSSSAVTTTTTTNQLLHSGPKDTKYSSNNFFNSLLGFVCVVAINDTIKHWIMPLDMPQLAGDLLRFLQNIYQEGPENAPSHSILRAFFTQSPFLISYNFLKKGQYFHPQKLAVKSNVLSKFIIYVSFNYLHLSDKAVHRLAFVLRETSIIVNYAYLVLCIHVISLTVSPFLQRIFILKDYSKTLDHLSSLTPDIPYSGFRGSSLNLPRDSASEVVVVNVEQPQQSKSSELNEIKVSPEIADSVALKAPAASHVSASNFEIFCLVPPTNKAAVVGSRTNINRTIVDRKRSNSNATPSTTIMDKYFTISIQPIWSWLAAIKILSKSPLFFAGESTKTKNNGAKFVRGPSEPTLLLAAAFIDETSVVFEAFDTDSLETLRNGISVRLNGIQWNHINFLLGADSEGGPEKVYICVYGLTPLFQYEIDFYDIDGNLLCHHVVNTVSQLKPKVMNVSLDASPILTLQSSLKSTLANLQDMKATYKKLKKDENKKAGDLKKQIDTLKSRIDKYGSKQVTDVRVSGKLKGLYHSVLQLENEIKEMLEQIEDMNMSSERSQDDYRAEEDRLTKEIADLEKYITDNELTTNKLKSDAKAVQADKVQSEMKRNKLLSKNEARKDEIVRFNAEIKSMKRAMIVKFQKRQRRVQERFDTILPNVTEATERLAEELESFIQNQAQA